MGDGLAEGDGAGCNPSNWGAYGWLNEQFKLVRGAPDFRRRNLSKLIRAMAPQAAYLPLIRECVGSHEGQQAILKSLNDETFAGYPLPKAYFQRVCRDVLVSLDEFVVRVEGAEAIDELYEFCYEGAAAGAAGCGPDMNVGWRAICLPTPRHLPNAPPVLLSTSALGGGMETGGRLWPSAVALFHMLKRSSEGCSDMPTDPLVRGLATGRPKVLELGAGTGFLGLALAHSRLAGEVVCTDGVPAVLANLERTVRSNKNALKGLTPGSSPAPVRVAKLDWFEPLDEFWAQSEVDEFDLVVAADVLYSEDLIPPLAKTLRNLLAQGRAKRALVVCMDRKGTHWDAFMEELGDVRKLQVPISPEVVRDCGWMMDESAETLRAVCLIANSKVYHS